MLYADFEYFLSVALLVTAMLGMGATLTTRDFLNVARAPHPIALMFLVQLVISPLVAIVLARILKLPPGVAIGLLLVAALPGGLFSNVITFFGRGNVALSVSATALASLTCMFTTSLVLRVGGSSEQLAEIQMPVRRILSEILLCMILPLVVGMVIRRFAVRRHAKISTTIIRISMVILALFVVAALTSGRIRPVELGWRPPLAMLLFCVFSIWLCYGGGALLRISVDDRFTICMECLVRNVQLGVLLKASLFPPGKSDVIGDGVLYSLLFYGGLCLIIAAWEAFCKRMELGLVYGAAKKARLAEAKQPANSD
jgi:BASS family bile acid:Na+ symporter